MARGFSEEEKLVIKKQLQEEFIKDLKYRTIQQIRIDDLVKRVGIAKGSFYLFYSSKEMLFADVTKNVQSEMVNDIIKIADDTTLNKKERLKKMLTQLMEDITNYFPWFQKLNTVDFEKSIRKLPKDIQQSLINDDVMDIKYILDKLKMETTVPIEELAAMIQIITFSSTARNDFGEAYSGAIANMIDVIVENFIKER